MSQITVQRQASSCDDPWWRCSWRGICALSLTAPIQSFPCVVIGNGGFLLTCHEISFVDVNVAHKGQSIAGRGRRYLCPHKGLTRLWQLECRRIDHSNRWCGALVWSITPKSNAYVDFALMWHPSCGTLIGWRALPTSNDVSPTCTSTSKIEVEWRESSHLLSPKPS